jgi:hypothetical protein
MATVTGISPVGTGTHSVAASYSGDTNYGASVSSTASLIGQVVGTTLTLRVNPSSGSFGQQIVLLASLSPSTEQGLSPSGTVSFYNGSTLLGTGTVSDGLATLNVTSLPAGAGSLTAFYGGDANFASSSTSASSFTVAKAGSSVVLTSSAANANAGSGVIFTATVTSATAGTPTGSVEFLNGSTVLGSAVLNAQGIATYTTSILAVGTDPITAQYMGDANFNGSTAMPYSQTVTAPNFALGLNFTSLTMQSGQTGQVAITLTPQGGFSGTVSFACSGLPSQMSCQFAPTSLTVNGANTPQTTVLTIAPVGTSASAAPMIRPGSSSSDPLRASLFLLPGILFGGLMTWQQKRLSIGLRCVVVLGILVSAMGGMTGCSSSSQPNNSAGTTPSVPAGTSTVMVTATSSTSTGISHTAIFTLTITQ